MCGIIGVRDAWLRAQGLDPETAVRHATAALQWRGPDGQGITRAGGWWLGCARLAITQPRSHQPVVRGGGRFAGVLNGAVTNARAMWSELRPRAARRAAPPNDAWLPLLAVAADRLELLLHLRGHHAYAVVDGASDTVVLGQDQHGEKPLLCLIDRGTPGGSLVAFGSTRPALEALGATRRWPAPDAAAWFRRGWAPAATGPAGNRVEVAILPVRGRPLVAGGAGGPAWWHAPGGDPPVPAEPGGGHAAPAVLRAHLVAGVARCVDTTVPVGLALSGGLDSSCLALALAELGRAVPAYQFWARGNDLRERAAARAAAAAAGLELRPVDGGPELLDALPELVRLAGEPLGDPSVLAMHAVARAAAADGIRVLLGGEGADELLLGYRRYYALRWLPRLHRLAWLHRLVPRWATGYPARWLRAALAADPIAALLAVVPPGFAAEVLAPELSTDSAPLDPVAGAALPFLARARDLDGYLRWDLLPKLDVAAMAAGVETRCPYLETRRELAPFGADRRCFGKAWLRAAFNPHLPEAVQRLGKRGFGLPLDRWFRGELRWLDLLAERRTRERPHLRPGGVARAVDRHRSGAANLGHALYLLVAWELYLRSREASVPD